MFCPQISGECAGPDCRDWDSKEDTCSVLLDRKGMADFRTAYQQFAQAYQQVIESEKLIALWNKLAINRLLADPMLGDEDKKIIKQALEAPSSEVAEKLLGDAGLI